MLSTLLECFSVHITEYSFSIDLSVDRLSCNVDWRYHHRCVIMKKGEDVVLLKNVIHFYSFIGTFPHIQKTKLMIILVPLQITGIICTANTYARYIMMFNSSFVGIVIHISFLLEMIIFSMICLKCVYTQETLWTNFFNEVEEFDVFMEENRELLKKSVFKYYSTFILRTITFLITTLVACSLLTEQVTIYQQMFSIIYSDIMMMHMTVTTLVLWKIFHILKKRFTFLENKIRYEFSLTNTDYRS